MQFYFPKIKRGDTIFAQRKAMLRMKKCTNTCKSSLGELDLYGQEVKLTYKGKESFATMPGTIVSIVIIAILLAFSAFKLFILTNRINPNISQQSFLRNLQEEEEFRPYESDPSLTTGKFDIAFGISQPLDPTIGYYVVYETHFYFEINNKTGLPVRQKVKRKLNIDYCGDKYFEYEDQEQVKLYGIDRLQCITKKDYALQGDYYSQDFKYLEFRLYKCNSYAANNKCQNQTTIDKYFENLDISFAFINSYFDFTDYGKPVKQFIDDSLFFQLESKRQKRANLMVMKAETELEDQLFQIGQQEESSFTMVNNIRTYDDTVDDSEGLLITVFLRYDNKYFSYNRQVYSILEYLGDIGGLQQMLYLIGLMLISYFTRRLFVSNLLTEMYQVKHDRGLHKGIKERKVFRENQMKKKSIAIKPLSMDLEKNNSVNNITHIDDKPNILQLPNRYSTANFNSGRELVNRQTFDQNVSTEWNMPELTQNEIVEQQTERDLGPIAGGAKRIHAPYNKSMIQNGIVLISQDVPISLPRPRINSTSSFQSTYDTIDEALKYKDKLKEEDINNLLLTIINRKRFKYSTSDIVAYIYKCMCLRRIEKNRRLESYKPHFLFQKCEELLNEELDVVQLMKQARNTKIMSQIMMNQKQKMLMRFQRKHLVETSSESNDSDSMPQFNTVKLMDSRNPLIRLSIFGRLKRMMANYRGNQLEVFDRRILRGLYQRRLRDYDEELIDQSKNISLLMRLKTDILRPKSRDNEAPNSHRRKYSEGSVLKLHNREDSDGAEVKDKALFELSAVQPYRYQGHIRKDSEAPLQSQYRGIESSFDYQNITLQNRASIQEKESIPPLVSVRNYNPDDELERALQDAEQTFKPQAMKQSLTKL
ncbi:hypothetical protein FGO68_gene6300 [Halteria grandinella]|uniref:Uncharacterized protein n=1 Tax=Halteria grandinella TaxID=5974 RepID=A0A8J8T6V1_HALGN|nr:hypothetical protein FGO68_gene6300 [Halteria grandinella]